MCLCRLGRWGGGKGGGGSNALRTLPGVQFVCHVAGRQVSRGLLNRVKQIDPTGRASRFYHVEYVQEGGEIALLGWETSYGAFSRAGIVYCVSANTIW